MQEAPVLSKKQQKGTVASKSKKTVLKQSLLTPYKLDWPFLDPDDHDTVFETVSRVLQGIMAKRKRPWVETTTGTVVEDMPEVKKRKNARSQLVCGLNEVIKNLERDRLRCFVVCQSAIPILPSKPLLLLSATRNCPGVCLNNFSDMMAKIFRFGSLAFGIKKPTADDVHVPELEEIVKVITEKSQAIKLPWLPEPEKIESCDKTKPDTESTETEKQITFEYQAANIGQIQPNPNKKRKKAKKGNKT